MVSAYKFPSISLFSRDLIQSSFKYISLGKAVDLGAERHPKHDLILPLFFTKEPSSIQSLFPSFDCFVYVSKGRKSSSLTCTWTFAIWLARCGCTSMGDASFWARGRSGAMHRQPSQTGENPRLYRQPLRLINDRRKDGKRDTQTGKQAGRQADNWHWHKDTHKSNSFTYEKMDRDRFMDGWMYRWINVRIDVWMFRYIFMDR